MVWLERKAEKFQALLIEEIDVTVGTGAVNEGGSSVDDKPEPTLGVEMIVERVDGILTFLTHAT